MRADQASVGNRPAHGTDEDNAASLLQAHHLPGNGLSSHEDARDVDAQHLLYILACVLERRSLLIDPGGGDEPVQPAMPARDLLEGLVEVMRVADVDAVVRQAGAQLRLGAVGDAAKVGRRVRQSVHSVHLLRPCVQERLSLHKTEAAAGARHDHNLAVEPEFGETVLRGGRADQAHGCLCRQPLMDAFQGPHVAHGRQSRKSTHEPTERKHNDDLGMWGWYESQDGVWRDVQSRWLARVCQGNGLGGC